MSITSGFAPVESGELYYEVAGEGQLLVLIHAGVADRRMWDPQFDAFARQFRVVRYDARGFGLSRTEATAFSNRQDLADLLNHLGVDRAYLIGVSRGGQIAVDFAVEHPARVAALIPVAAGLSGFDFEPIAADMAINHMFMEMEELWNARDFERLTELEVRMWADGPGQPAGRAPAHVRELVRQMCLENYRRQDGEATPIPLDPPAAGRLGEIAAFTLVIVGDLDTRGTLLMADALAAGIAGARKVVFPGVAHMVPMEASEVFNRVVTEFLRATF